MNTIIYEAKPVEGIEVFHTFRGHNLEVEVYTFQDGNITYNLFKKKTDTAWRCDWVTSYNWQEITLNADATNQAAMVSAFAQMLKTRLAPAGH